jgi:hypothetical protein
MQLLMAGDGIHHLEPKLERTEKLDNVARVAAGQVCQVDTGNKGKPPYLLQAEWPGVTPQFSSLKNLSGLGRTMYNRQLPIAEITKEGTLYARGCEPLPKPADRLRKSHSMQAILQYVEHEGGDAEREQVQRKELGRKRLATPRPDHIDPLRTGDELKPRDEKNYRHPNMPKRTTHHFTDEGLVELHLDKSPKYPNIPKLAKKPPSPIEGFGKSSRMDVHRFDTEFPKPTKRCLSAPPSQINGDPITHFENGEGANPQQYSKRAPGLRPNGVHHTLKHLTPEEVAIEREGRMNEDSKFFEHCQKLAEAHTQMKELVSANKQRVHHMGSSSMAGIMEWNTN